MASIERIIAKALLKSDLKALEGLLNRCYGKAGDPPVHPRTGEGEVTFDFGGGKSEEDIFDEELKQ